MTQWLPHAKSLLQREMMKEEKEETDARSLKWEKNEHTEDKGVLKQSLGDWDVVGCDQEVVYTLHYNKGPEGAGF